MEPAQRADWIRSLFEQYRGPLVRYAARLTGDLDTARDVVQEAFIQLCQMDPSKLDSRPGPWLYTVCRNRAVDGLRKEARMSQLSEAQVDSVEAPAPSPLHLVERGETTSAVLRALESLPANQQEVVRLKFQDGLSYREISEITGHSIGNVGFLIHVGIRRIRETLRRRETR
ncbi:MAG: sigma-70 family RNA polymerase sigma factor [Acidobacteriota bacterium]